MTRLLVPLLAHLVAALGMTEAVARHPAVLDQLVMAEVVARHAAVLA